MDLLRAMESFTRVATAKSFTTAAEGMGLSRAIVSKHVKDLESHLGVRLIHRTTRRLSLTEIGSKHYAFCTRILEQIAAEHEEAAELQSTPRGAIRLLAPKSFGNMNLAGILSDFAADYSDISVSLLLTDDSFNALNLVDNGIDLAIRLSAIGESTIVSRKIGVLPWLLCASPAYLKKAGVPRRPEDLTRHNCLTHLKYTPDDMLSMQSTTSETSVRLAGRFSANSSLALRAGALRGLGIAVLPAYSVADDLRTGKLTQVLPAYSLPTQPVYALYPHQRSLPAKVRLLIDYLAERLAETSGPRAAKRRRTANA